MTTNNTRSLMKMLNAMSVEELRTIVAPYLDRRLNENPVGVEVKLSDEPGKSDRYVVVLAMEDGSEKEVKFIDRPSRLFYIYTLLHPKGYQRRSLMKNNYQPLRELYSKLYFSTADAMLKSIEKLGFEQFCNQAVAQSRVAIRKTIANAEPYEIARPQRNMGKTLIPFAANGGVVIIDNTLL